MFGRNHFVCPPSGLKTENLKSRKVVRFLTENYINENGDSEVRVVQKEIDLSVPQTPQSGLECVALDLSYAMRYNLPIQENGSRLSLLGGGNPLADFRVISSIMHESENPEFNKPKEKE